MPYLYPPKKVKCDLADGSETCKKCDHGTPHKPSPLCTMDFYCNYKDKKVECNCSPNEDCRWCTLTCKDKKIFKN